MNKKMSYSPVKQSLIVEQFKGLLESYQKQDFSGFIHKLETLLLAYKALYDRVNQEIVNYANSPEDYDYSELIVKENLDDLLKKTGQEKVLSEARLKEELSFVKVINQQQFEMTAHFLDELMDLRHQANQHVLLAQTLSRYLDTFEPEEKNYLNFYLEKVEQFEMIFEKLIFNLDSIIDATKKLNESHRNADEVL